VDNEAELGRVQPGQWVANPQHRFQCIPDGYRLADKSLEGGDAMAGVHRGSWRGRRGLL
jgi:hypothetical protein